MKRIAATTAALAIVATGSFAANAADSTAPTYMEALATGAQLSVLATGGDKFGTYQIPGIPDGLGAYKSGENIKVLMNHELSAAGIAGTITRANGKTTGTTITEFLIDPKTNKVLSAQEAIKKVSFYNYKTAKYSSAAVAPLEGTLLEDSYGKYHTNALSRFCSSSFAPAGTFATKVNGKTVGYTGGVYLTGEEIGDEGRGFAMNTAGELVQIPRFGLASWETFSAIATGSVKTSIIGTEDGPNGASELWLYEGNKTNKGTWYDKAGFTNGKSYVLNVAGATDDTEFRAAFGKGKAVDATFATSYWNYGGALQNTWAQSTGFGFSAVEDGAFDPNNPNDYYFVQKSSAGKATTLNPDDKTVVKRDGGSMWKISFKDIKNPSKGATLELVLDGMEAPYLNMPDNIDIDDLGNILIQEDPGNNAQLSRVIAYNIKTKKMATIARFKAEYFSPTAPAATKITEDEESSGIIDVTRFYKKSSTDAARYYLLDAQVHAPTAKARPDITDAAAVAELEKLVESGQLYLLTIADWSKVDFK